VPTYKDVEDVLARWREAERQLEAAPPGSPDAEGLTTMVEALRDEYHRLQEESRAEPGSAQPQLSN
jgi:hypothetical protein